MEIPKPKYLPKFQVINGFHFSPKSPEKNIISALSYKAKDDDLFIVTYPKCGTTWTQQILVLLFENGDMSDEFHLYNRIPFLDSHGSEAVESIQRPGAIKSHLPFELIPYNEKAKYIFVVRNPKDACVSYYYHTKLFKQYEYNGDFHDFILAWLHGDVGRGRYDKYVLSWWTHRNDSNVLFLLYENMKSNLRESILKIAKFISEEMINKLLKNPDILDKIIKRSDVNYMKKTTNEVFEKRWHERKSLNEDANHRFIRKGIVGDWKNHFTAEENTLFEQWFEFTFKGTGVECLWDEYNVFEYRLNKINLV